MGDFKKIGYNYGHNNIVVFAERGDFDENDYLIKEEGNHCEGVEHLGLIVKAPCPLGAFGYDLIKNNFIADYFSKRFLINNDRLILNRLMDLFELTFTENNIGYALIVGPPESSDVIYPLITSLSEVFNFTAFFPNNKNHLFTVPISLDFDNAMGKYYHEFKVTLN